MADQYIRKVQIEDLNGLKGVLDSSELFPSEYLEEMIADYFQNKDTEAIWFTCIDDNKPIALGYCAPEKLTNGTYNLYAIAVRKEFQGQGIGRKMMHFIERILKENGKRIFIVETSSIDNYSSARKFYQKLGYRLEAVIKDFWNEGEDKLIFWKKLN
ncbi:GNAT family N-acetyltransferase [Parasediminibacterium paludis]|uniref:GNAT family N-acetyltransferase n=1 Tax=Parasediminibacterium paludis TaxID=908966 RepID=A0ABV8PWE2_9BACT